MPFRSERQRRYLHANEPAVAARWEREARATTGKEVPTMATKRLTDGGGRKAPKIGPTRRSLPRPAQAAPGKVKKAAGSTSAKPYTPGATKGKGLGVNRAGAGPTGKKPAVAAKPAAASKPAASQEPSFLDRVGSFIKGRNDAATGRTSSPISRAMRGAEEARKALRR